MPRGSFLLSLATNPKDIAALLSPPIVFRQHAGHFLAGFDSRGDGEIPGGVKLFVPRIGIHPVPLTQQPIIAKQR